MPSFKWTTDPIELIELISARVYRNRTRQHSRGGAEIGSVAP
jgi:hypothetical protein